MKKGLIISVILTIAAVVGLGAVFVNNANPYVTIAEAKKLNADVHVAGELVPGSIQQDGLAQVTRFELKDPSGTIKVVYTGPPQSNLATATQVVVIGQAKEGVFKCDKMLVKCPSKYENEEQPKA